MNKALVANKILNFLHYWSHKHQLSLNLKINKISYINTGAFINEKSVSVGKHTFINSQTYIYSGEIGSYCSIAQNVLIGAEEHPAHYASTHAMFYHPDWLESDPWEQPKSAPIIGNDVWIGCNVTILRGSVIEDGAIIGAGSLVNGFVPAYSIVVGTPARVLRYRFDKETINSLLKSQWWDLDDEKVEELKPLFSDPKKLIPALNFDYLNKAVT